jgi:hypothetical protein
MADQFLADIDLIEKVANYGRNDSNLTSFMHLSETNNLHSSCYGEQSTVNDDDSLKNL